MYIFSKLGYFYSFSKLGYFYSFSKERSIVKRTNKVEFRLSTGCVFKIH